MKARLARTLAVGALSGAGSEAALAALLRNGLLTLVRVRAEACRMDPGGTLLNRQAVRVRLPQGAKGRLWLHTEPASRAVGTVLTVTRRSGSHWSTQDPAWASRELSRRCRHNLDAAMRVVLAIEHARKLCCSVFEEATRWLPQE